MISIAIDGPSAAGKSTVSKLLAEKLGILYLNTGSIYRACALYYISNNIDVKNKELIEAYLENIEVEIKFIDNQQVTYLNGVDVTAHLHNESVSDKVAYVAMNAKVREKTLGVQRKIASERDVLIEGRDIASVVLPEADFKFYIDASAHVRAQRRMTDEKNTDTRAYEEVLASIEERDHADKTREISPLILVEDAMYVNTDEYSIDEVVDLLYNTIKSKGMV